MKKIILLNAPPRAGKDTYQQNCDLDHHHVKFATAVKNGTHGAFRLDVKTSWYEDCKDEINTNFLGVTPREAYIAYSEQLMKPLLGRDVFGKIVSGFIIGEQDSLYIITDSGFATEANVIIEEFGKENVMLVRIHREGCDFQGDSRSYIQLDVESHDVHNDGTVSEMVSDISKLIRDFIK